VSFDDGGNWQPLRLNLPIVPIHDLAVKEGDLIAATHGRSFWILDDLSPLRQLNPAIVAKNNHLFKPRDVYRASFGGGGGTGAAGGHPSGQNPPAGAVVYYWLKSPRQVVMLDFVDSAGKVIRSFTSNQDPQVRADSLRADSIRRVRGDTIRATADSAARSEARSEETPEDAPRRAPPPPRVSNKAGLNSFSWNLRYPDAVSFENMILWAAGTQGPTALPGRYGVRMTVAGGPPETQRFILRPDPRSKTTRAELAEQFAFLTAVRDRTTDANNAVRTIRNVRSQIANRQSRLPEAQRAAFAQTAGPLLTNLASIEGEIYQVRNQSGQDPLNYPIKLNNKIAALAGVASDSDTRPTSQTREVFRILSGQLDAQLERLRVAMKGLGPLNTQLKSTGLPLILPSTDEIPAVRPATGS
jgi:hypothetical protein